MSDLLAAWLTPQGIIALGVVANVIQSLINRHNIKKIELATNSMKDALVEATARASHAEGRSEGIREERNGKRP